ncbi:MAG: GAF domain-containing protein [Gemmatimonas sp.]|nr:GAF domain-containing protein [Gemmatimonas sp.]
MADPGWRSSLRPWIQMIPSSSSDHDSNPGTVELRRRTRELEILNAVAESLNASVDISESLEAVLSRVADLLGLRTGWVWLLDEASGEPYLAAAQELPAGLRDNPATMEGSCYCLDTYRLGDLNGAANINVVTCSRLRWLKEGAEGLRFHASVPLYARGKRLGVLNVGSPEWRRLSPDELRLLHTIGDMLGVAIERARLYARSLELGATEERNRLARELHDTLAQSLTGIALQLEAAEELIEEGVEAHRVAATVGSALATTRLSLDEARRSVLDLRAAPLEGRTLANALAILAAEADLAASTDVDFEATGAAQPLPARITAGVYRVAQEALTNALRHANARRIEMHLTVQPERLQLRVEDDGGGFEPGEGEPGRLGLVGINERVRLLGGTLKIETAPAAGTRLLVSIPLADG